MLDLWLFPVLAVVALIVAGVYLCLRKPGPESAGKSPLELAQEMERREDAEAQHKLEVDTLAQG